MNLPNVHRWCVTSAAALAAVFFLLAGLPGAWGEAATSPLSPEKGLMLGERMYREGILPSGEPVQALVKGDILLPGTSFTCISCHQRSGLGSVEGGVYTPPTNGAKLFKPLQAYSSATNDPFPFKPSQLVQQHLKNYIQPPLRPAYTDASLADVLRDGVDAAGRTLNDVMPRYLLDDGDMNLLIAYLKSLSSEFSPGVSDTTVRFATVIADDVGPAERNAMLIPLENFIRNTNLVNFPEQGGGERSTATRSRLMSETMLTPRAGDIRKLALSRWVLKGPPETWRDQLEAYYRAEPVFALIGGITTGEWQPIHQFSEDHRIPCLLPITGFPVISRTDWHTLYVSKGYYQEGEAAAQFLNARDDVKGRPIVQIVRDTREGRALSRGFQEAWHELGHTTPVTVVLKPGDTVTAGSLRQELARETSAAVILWDGPESLPALEMLAGDRNRPAMLLVSSSFLGAGMFALNEQVRDFTYLTYPYGVSWSPQDGPAPPMGPKVFSAQANCVATTRISQQAYLITLILNMALKDMQGNYYRDNLLDVIGMIMDQEGLLYERLSFGPGQRYASKGCYIVQLDKGPTPRLIKKSGWVTH
jgi:ABC-type branched-subunit amino acid transport system substrate-binding protein